MEGLEIANGARVRVSATVLICRCFEKKLAADRVLRGQNEDGFIQPFSWRKLVKMVGVFGTFLVRSEREKRNPRSPSIRNLGSYVDNNVKIYYINVQALSFASLCVRPK